MAFLEGPEPERMDAVFLVTILVREKSFKAVIELYFMALKNNNEMQTDCY